MNLKVTKCRNLEPISFSDFIFFLDKNLDFSSERSISSCITALERLYCNKDFLKDYLVSSISNSLKEFESHNKYNPPSIILADRERFIVRANLWRPTKSFKDGDINVYGLAHDHNFNFLSLNYWGPGYESEMYEYNYAQVCGIPGEQCNVDYHGIMNLKQGEIYFYRKNKDIHSQLPPSSPTITINVMEKIDVKNHSRQYIFDLKNKVIKSVYGDFYAKKYVYDMAFLINSASIDNLLKQLFDETKCSLTKSYLTQRLRDKYYKP